MAAGGDDGAGKAPAGEASTTQTVEVVGDAPSSSPKPSYSQATRLREETEAPFRKARMFVFGASAASAGVGSLVAASRVVAAAVGVRGVQPLDETLPNLAINAGVLLTCAFLLRQEVRTGERRMSRLARGASLARLKVTVPPKEVITKLGGLRSKRRLVILAGREPILTAAVASAEQFKEALYDRRILVVPLLLPPAAGAAEAEVTFPTGNWIASPVLASEWLEWFAEEKVAAKVNEERAADEVLVIIVKFNGRVGSRSMGMPAWSQLVGDIDTIADGEGPPTRTPATTPAGQGKDQAE
eukprot:TRINITY_DN1926_c0_g1_i1.p2 TRINITY_DN1926_c0_g1~~TRINITY_DN1926_c0_g1_i1.p2  ORF type:complete len:299 (+),score=102.67 TRINITY_DN1926_c0_g1_i1:511-1407(+)